MLQQTVGIVLMYRWSGVGLCEVIISRISGTEVKLSSCLILEVFSLIYVSSNKLLYSILHVNVFF